MQKIMFSERYGLEQAVLAGTKTMTRRIIKGVYVAVIHLKYEGSFIGKTADGESVILPQPKYEVGEEVAIAQRYKDLWAEYLDDMDNPIYKELVENFSSNLFSAGHDNKMFVKADLMPHRIRITGIKAERLQDITDEDAMREGIRQSVVEYGDKKIVQWTYFGEKITTWFDSPREAFAALIDRISGRGTWQSNPWTYAYTFELIK